MPSSRIRLASVNMGRNSRSYLLLANRPPVFADLVEQTVKAGSSAPPNPNCEACLRFLSRRPASHFVEIRQPPIEKAVFDWPAYSDVSPTTSLSVLFHRHAEATALSISRGRRASSGVPNSLR